MIVIFNLDIHCRLWSLVPVPFCFCLWLLSNYVLLVNNYTIHMTEK